MTTTMTNTETIHLYFDDEIYIKMPKKFYFKNTPFSDQVSNHVRVEIGEVFTRKVERKEQYIDELVASVKRALYYDGDIRKEVEAMLESLGLDYTEDEVFDTSIYEGEYYVKEVTKNGKICVKVDDPSIEVFVK